MKTEVTLNQSMFETLLKQTVDLEEQMPSMLDEFFAGGMDAKTLKQREEIESLLTAYLQQLNGLVTDIQINDCNGGCLPFVTLGSTVNLENIDSGEVSEFIVVTPYEIDRRAGKISFLSPLGKALLLKKPGDTFHIQVPRGIIQYKVIEIRY